MPNTFAYLTLILWPLVAIRLYQKKEVIPATFWTIVGGYLLLPVGISIDFPVIPALGKETIPAIMAYVGCKYIAKVNITLLPAKGIERTLIIVLFLGAFGTVITNGNPIEETDRLLPGLGYRDIFTVVVAKGLLLLPFSIALQLIKTSDDQLQVFKLLVVAGLLYSILIIFEIRMSPQLHKSLYGFFPHTWGQQVRYGGFRPVVFLGHGLWVSIFIVMVMGAALTLSKQKIKLTRFPNSMIIMYLILLLIFSKGFGSMILGAVLLISIWLFRVGFIYMTALVIGIIAVAYPFLCLMDIFPHQYIIEQITAVNSLQAGSLQFRFNHEIALLERAVDRWLFGWGAWGRNRLLDSVVDGYWIGLIGSYGVIGYSAIFGLMFVPLWKVAACLKLLVDEKERFLLACHSLMVALILIDQIPNHSENPLFWFLIGSLAGRQAYIVRLRPNENNNKVVNSHKNSGTC